MVGVPKDVKLAEFWVLLARARDCIDNELLPLAGYLGFADDAHDVKINLLDALESASTAITEHFRVYKLQASHVGYTQKPPGKDGDSNG